jgi:exo-beta-1,3-glucanase (GH17 family)
VPLELRCSLDGMTGRSTTIGLALGLALACGARAERPAPKCPLSGLAFGAYLDGQDPAQGLVLGEAQLRERLALLHGRTRWIRSYGSTHGLEAVGRLAHEAGFETAIGAWLGADLAANEAEIANLIAAARAGDVDVAIVGSEVLLRGELSASQLVGYIARVRAAIPADVPVTSAEPHEIWAAHPELVDAVDTVFAHFYPFWEGRPIEDAILQLHLAFRSLAARVAPKPVVVAETGWPSAGEPVGAALPSKKNAASYLIRFLSWAEAHEVSYIYFAAVNEAWKTRLEGERAAHWGVALANGRPKKGLKRALRCVRAKRPEPGLARVPDDDSPGPPALALSIVPPLGSTQNLRGSASFLVPAEFAVAVYIFVPSAGGWWTKPTFAAPKVALDADGSFTVDVTTGGNDASATQIAAFLVPWSFVPPPAAGLATLPAALFGAAADYEIVPR